MNKIARRKQKKIHNNDQIYQSWQKKLKVINTPRYPLTWELVQAI